jgi:hypothetical protein
MCRWGSSKQPLLAPARHLFQLNTPATRVLIGSREGSTIQALGPRSHDVIAFESVPLTRERAAESSISPSDSCAQAILTLLSPRSRTRVAPSFPRVSLCLGRPMLSSETLTAMSKQYPSSCRSSNRFRYSVVFLLGIAHEVFVKKAAAEAQTTVWAFVVFSSCACADGPVRSSYI